METIDELTAFLATATVDGILARRRLECPQLRKTRWASTDDGQSSLHSNLLFLPGKIFLFILMEGQWRGQ
ncbi:hypothetical protein [Aquamicrobium terrae]|uniref:Uncharacterized protein n=1 Tax=Aquamicrobium terrae TaxID=1324945 RepID=A0ABV2N2N0_9HYPH